MLDTSITLISVSGLRNSVAVTYVNYKRDIIQVTRGLVILKIGNITERRQFAQ